MSTHRTSAPTAPTAPSARIAAAMALASVVRDDMTMAVGAFWHHVDIRDIGAPLSDVDDRYWDLQHIMEDALIALADLLGACNACGAEEKLQSAARTATAELRDASHALISACDGAASARSACSTAPPDAP
jgi:hypothetical protein